MRLVLSETLGVSKAPIFELPKHVTAATYFHTSYGNGYGSVSFSGISSAQLHDIIGCPVQEAYRGLETAARGHSHDRVVLIGDPPVDAGAPCHICIALAALDTIRKGKPCAADADIRDLATAESVPPTVYSPQTETVR